ncbi:hypothetical protein AOQ84DRAFT_389220 [Glonium stellatum]|uniref:Uncharacterized protein n=1 Tax=Glonium stellatum TaxID=574774 RepID=A0A8E2JSK9_9PEZI|nr:hypothetical protein AOQ84DRAFT_389220 [Glonium stellatum]
MDLDSSFFLSTFIRKQPEIYVLFDPLSAMDGLSSAASVFAVVSLSLQLADGFNKLYKFWVSIQEAPNYVAVIFEDLLYLSTVLKDIPLDQNQTYAVKFGLECCQGKIVVT